MSEYTTNDSEMGRAAEDWQSRLDAIVASRVAEFEDNPDSTLQFRRYSVPGAATAVTLIKPAAKSHCDWDWAVRIDSNAYAVSSSGDITFPASQLYEARAKGDSLAGVYRIASHAAGQTGTTQDLDRRGQLVSSEDGARLINIVRTMQEVA